MKISSQLATVTTALLLAWCVGILCRGYWTPDEPREADLAWRMSWQSDKAVPSLAGEAFCEKPPLTYWLAGAAMARFGTQGWAARLPNLLYALITALGIGAIARRGAGAVAAVVAAAAVSTFLLSYQVGIWLATDAPLVAAVAVALLGLYRGYYAQDRRERLGGYWLMHAALAVAFFCKSAAAFMVPVLTLLTLALWERRWRELRRFELYAGATLPLAAILLWVWFVYQGADGPAHLRVFFWNNLVGRFAEVPAAGDLQYAAGHRNSPGKYLLELPAYLWPWTLLVLAAARRAWQRRTLGFERGRLVRFGLAAALPPLVVLSLAATARNIYLAPALPGAALLLGWWAQDAQGAPDPWDLRAVRATAALLIAAAIAAAAAMLVIGADARAAGRLGAGFIVVSAIGLAAGLSLAAYAWYAARHATFLAAQRALLLAYCALLIGPASQAYAQVNTWQDLGSIGRAVQRDAAGAPLLLFAPDETTRAFVDLYARRAVTVISGPIDAGALRRLAESLDTSPQTRVLVQLPGRELSPALQSLIARLRPRETEEPASRSTPAWLASTSLGIAKLYALPNGRRYALLERKRLGGTVASSGERPHAAAATRRNSAS